MVILFVLPPPRGEVSQWLYDLQFYNKANSLWLVTAFGDVFQLGSGVRCLICGLTHENSLQALVKCFSPAVIRSISHVTIKLKAAWIVLWSHLLSFLLFFLISPLYHEWSRRELFLLLSEDGNLALIGSSKNFSSFIMLGFGKGANWTLLRTAY